MAGRLVIPIATRAACLRAADYATLTSPLSLPSAVGSQAPITDQTLGWCGHGNPPTDDTYSAFSRVEPPDPIDGEC